VRGVLITLEGIDGSGKSTVLRGITEKLKETLPDRKLTFTAEPTTRSRPGKVLREVFLKEGPSLDAFKLEELFLFLADHANHLEATVRPSLEKGQIIISDRYSDSTAAYQGATLQGIVPDPVAWIRSICQPWDIIPDLTLLFSLDPDLAMGRISQRSGREKFERADFLGQVDENFKRLAVAEPDRFVVLDASREEERISEETLRAILNLVMFKG
jgi:dTMP kinase